MQTIAILPGALPKTEKNVALVSPMFDALFVCGLIPFAMAVIARFGMRIDSSGSTVQPVEQALVIPYMVASLLIGESHQFTSIIRYFSKPFKATQFKYDRLAIRFILITSLFALSVLFFPSLFFPTWISVPVGFIAILAGVIVAGAVLLFPAVLAHHVLAQSRAIGTMYCSKSGYQLTPRQHGLQNCLMLTLVATAATSFAQPFHHTFVTFEVNWSLAQPLFCVITIALCVAFACTTITRGIREKSWPPELACLLWISNVLLVVTPLDISMYAWLFAPVFMHATQHWSVAWSVRLKELAAKDQRPAAAPGDTILQLLAMVSPSVALTLLILFSPQVLGPNQLGNVTLGAVPSMFIFYLHYFTDRIVWRRA